MINLDGREPPLPVGDVGDFVPARSKLEAVTRISALTHSPPETLGPGSKERKSVLVNLAAGFEIELTDRLPKPRVAALIAVRLGVSWDTDCRSTGDTITLVGLNRLLAGAERGLRRSEAARRLAVSTQAREPEFEPARGKLEAVSRISAVTGAPPQSLGPGSKERKSALVHLAMGLELAVDLYAAKPELGRQIAVRLGVPWGDDCWSAGQTITLTGLNRLLLGAEREMWARLPRAPRLGPFADSQSEAVSLLEVIAASLPPLMDGVGCIEQMQAGGSTNWAQDEWPGFYFEYVGLPACVNAFSGGPVSFANTRFDYSLGDVWDLKVHTRGRDVAPLNAVDAVQACLSTARGVGFIVMSGSATYDNGEFRQWLRERRLAAGKAPARRSTPAAYARASKVTFSPERLEAFHIRDETELARAQAAGEVRVMQQGRQTSGAARKPKYMLDLRKARRGDTLIAERDLAAGPLGPAELW